MNFIDRLKSNENYRKQLLDDIYEEDGYYSNSDLGNAIILSAKRVVYTIRKSNGPEMIDDHILWGGTVVREPLLNPSKCKWYPETKEEFISLMNEWNMLAHTDIINKFKEHIRGENIPSSKIEHIELDKILHSYKEDIKGLINEVSDLEEWDIVDMTGYSPHELSANEADECINYSKEIIIDLIQEVSKEIINIICNNGLNLNLQMDAIAIKSLLIHKQTHNSALNYGDNKDIVKHFIITSNIIIYDPCVQRIFEKELVSLSRELDKLDKALGLEKPSMFGFEQFINPLYFKAVRLDKKGNFIAASDIENYIAILMDGQATPFIIKSNRKTT